MIAYRTTMEIENNVLQLKIPKKLSGKNVEIIILETNIQQKTEKKERSRKVKKFYDSFTIVEDDSIENISKEPNEFQKLLLSAPVWNDENYNSFKEIHNAFNKWKVL